MRLVQVFPDLPNESDLVFRHLPSDRSKCQRIPSPKWPERIHKKTSVLQLEQHLWFDPIWLEGVPPRHLFGHLLRFDIWTPKTYLKHQSSGGMTGCLGLILKIRTGKELRNKRGFTQLFQCHVGWNFPIASRRGFVRFCPSSTSSLNHISPTK